MRSETRKLWRPILDYAAEADLPEASTSGAAAAAGPSEKLGPGWITFATHGVSTPPVYSARVYHYTDERQCDQNAAIFAEAICAVRDTTPGNPSRFCAC